MKAMKPCLFMARRSVLLVVAFMTLSPASSLGQQVIVGVASVIDGDTIEIHGQRIRFWGIDAPESSQLCLIQGKPWRCGQRAALALSDWIGRRTVACNERGRDRYRRVVAVCTVAGEDVAVWLVRLGWALDWPKYSKGKYAKQEDEAAAAKVGIWQGQFQMPWEWRKPHDGG